MKNEPNVMFPRTDYSRVPFGIYHDPEIFDQEMERIFRGPTWLFLGWTLRFPTAAIFGLHGWATRRWCSIVA